MGESNKTSWVPLSRKEVLGGVALALYWGCALLEAGEDAAAITYGIPWLSVAGFIGLFFALLIFGAIPHAVASKVGSIIVRVIIVGGPLSCALASALPLGQDHVSMLAFAGGARVLMGVSMGLMLGHLGAFLAHCKRTQAAILAVAAFLFGAVLYVACSGFLIDYGRLAVAALATVAGIAFVLARFDERGHVAALSAQTAGTHEELRTHPLKLPMGFWTLFLALLFYSVVYGINIPLTLDVGQGSAHTTPVELVLLAPGIISLIAIMRFQDSFDFRRFQWFLFAPSVIALLVLPFAGREVALACCAVLIMVFSFFDLASFILLVDLARNRSAALTMRVFAWGRMANFAGMGLGWALATGVLGTSLDQAGQPVTTCAFIGVAVLVVLMTFFGNAHVGPVHADDTEGDADPSTFDERCDAVAAAGKLSARETELLKLLARGRSSTYIAETLYLSPSTVKTHTYRIYRKLDVHSRQELISLIERGAAASEAPEKGTS